METTKIVSSMLHNSQLNQHVSRLAVTESAINNDRRCRSGRDWTKHTWPHGVARLQSIQRVLPASPDVFSITGVPQLELELAASVNPSHPTDDIGEES